MEDKNYNQLVKTECKQVLIELLETLKKEIDQLEKIQYSENGSVLISFKKGEQVGLNKATVLILNRLNFLMLE